MAMVATVKEHRYRELFINVIPKHHHQHVGILSFRRNATTSHSDWFRWFSACWHWKSMPRPRDGFSRSTFRTRSRGEHTHTHTDTAIAKVRALARKTTNEWRLQKKANTHTKNNSNNTANEEKKQKRKNEQKRKFQNSEIPKNPFLSLLLVIRCLFVCAHAWNYFYTPWRAADDTIHVRNTVGDSAGVSLLRSLFYTDTRTRHTSYLLGHLNIAYIYYYSRIFSNTHSLFFSSFP